MEAIDKLRALINWANYQSEVFNERFISIGDIEIVYDYCQLHNSLEFLDSESLSYLSNEEYDKVVSEVCLLLGYSIF